MYRKHPRHVTQEQFADATTVDGSRIDTAMDQLVERHNNVPASDIRTRYTANTYFTGWIPEGPVGSTGAPTFPGPRFPWLHTYNDSFETVGADVPAMSNPQRIKGYQIPGVRTVRTALNQEMQYAFTTCYSFTEPAIIKRIFVQLAIDAPLPIPAGATYFDLPGTYPGPNTPDPFSVGDFSQDFVVVLEATSPFSPEDRQHDDVEVTRNNFAFAKDAFRAVPWPVPAAFTDMEPGPWPGGQMAGYMIPLEVDVPIHEVTRVRLSLVIPPPVGILGGPYNSCWKIDPWFQCHWGVTLVALERITS